MKILKIRHVKLTAVIGFGYWKDDYNLPDCTGFAYYVILPFVRIQFGSLIFTTL